MTLGFYPRTFPILGGLTRFFSFNGTCERNGFVKVLAFAFGMSFVMGPILGLLAVLASGAGPAWPILPISFAAWAVQGCSVWLTLACIVCRCRDAFGKVLMPLAALLGFFVAPFFILAFLGPLLPSGLADFMQGQSTSSAIVAGLILSLVTFAPGLVWLGLQESQPVKALRSPTGGQRRARSHQPQPSIPLNPLEPSP